MIVNLLQGLVIALITLAIVIWAAGRDVYLQWSRRKQVLVVSSMLCMMLPDSVPLPYRPPLYGMALFLAFCSGWPPPTDHVKRRLVFLQDPDGRIHRNDYFMFAWALSVLMTSLIGVFLYSID